MLIKKIVKIAILLFVVTLGTSQDIVYVTNWKSEADVDIMIVDKRSLADVVINLAARPHEIRRSRNSWAFTKYANQATLRVRIVDTPAPGVVRVYIQNPPSNLINQPQRKSYRIRFNKSLTSH